jgi:NADPH:quinone reductase-like Zn-dependent oxidoreductase
VRAAVTTGDPKRPLALAECPAPEPAANEALVRVVATAFDDAELRYAVLAPAGEQLGWNVSGFIEVPAADGSGPPKGARVVAFVANGAWAELVAVEVHRLCTIPANLGFDDAATLPAAGLNVAQLGELAVLAGEKKLEPKIAEKFRYDQLDLALDAILDRGVTGKVIVRFSP